MNQKAFALARGKMSGNGSERPCLRNVSAFEIHFTEQSMEVIKVKRFSFP